ncbi:MAG: putative bifunctional diguanylate cyclase/phosphodiesterase, partial [Clostridium sp.]
TFNSIIVHILTAAMLIPFVSSMIIDMKKANNEISSMVDSYANEIFDYINGDVGSLNKSQLINLKLGAMLEVGKLEESILLHSKHKKFNIHILNNKDQVILDIKNNDYEIEDYSNYESIDDEGQYIYKMMPKPSQFKLLKPNWLDGFYIYERDVETGEFTVLIEVPISLYKERILLEYMSQFKFLIFFALFMAVIAMILNRVIFNDLYKISLNTKDIKRYIQGNEEIVWPSSNIIEIKNLVDNIKIMIGELVSNFSELKKSEEKLYELAYYDTLTALPNRLYFRNTLEKFVKESKENEKIGIVFLDLNRFKVINDTLGHDIGDKLLVEVAIRLNELNSDKITVYRLGGDEFVISVKINERSEIELLGEAIKGKFENSFILDDVVLNVSCSMGASVYPEDSTNINSIIQYADVSMYKAKENQEACIQLFNNDIKEKVLEKLVIEKEIFNAIEKDEFTLFYQPKYSCDIEVTSIEALIRWSNETLGVVPPDKFISIAEESDLILKIDRWVLFKACNENKRLQDEGYQKIPVSVNMSAKHFANEEIERIVLQALENSGLEPKYLTIEITEGVLIKNFEIVEKVIRKINKIGVAISIDDFGKGYSSFNQLMKLPINEVKIDKSFIRDIHKESKKANIVQGMVELAHRLSLNVVAEGIETDDERRFVKSIGCNELQGYLFSKPVPLDKLKSVLIEEEID